jgi:hypothetical protein
MALLLIVFAAASPCQVTPSGAPPISPRLRESVTQQGPFAIADQQYTVLFHYQVLSGGASHTPASARSTLSQVEIGHPQGPAVYQESFSYAVSQGRLQQNLTAMASIVPGNGGDVLIIRFLDHAAESADGASGLAQEWWQLFTVVNKEFKPLGPPLPLGQGTDITVNHAVAAVMTKGGIEVVPMASTAEVLALPAWTGNFYAQVPMRFDWAHGQWGEGEACYRNADGSLTERGCIMQLEAVPQPRSPDADIVAVQLFSGPNADGDDVMDGPRNVLVTPTSRVEVLEMQGIAQWNKAGPQGQGVACTLSDVWLRVRLDGQEGWVHGQDAFDALGLPRTNPH